MLENMLYLQVEDLPSARPVTAPAERPAEGAVLMCRPTHFCVASAINPHMLTATGELQVVDHRRAVDQWQRLHDELVGLGLRVELIDPEAGLPDMVFTANQSFPFLDNDGRRKVLISRMRSEERRPEAAYFRQWYAGRGYHEVPFDYDEGESLEGMGDLLWVMRRRLLLAGIGPRTSRSVVERLPETLETPVFGLELVDPRFYHLDTALAVLDANTALVHPGAFSSAGMALLEAVFSRLLVAPEEECLSGFACNALGLPSGHVLVDAACPETATMLHREGFLVLALDTEEFRKSGGSVFCMTMLLPEGA